MIINIHKDDDILYIELDKEKELYSAELNDDVYVGIDKDENVTSIEILNFSDYTELNIPSTLKEAEQFFAELKPEDA